MQREEQARHEAGGARRRHEQKHALGDEPDGSDEGVDVEDGQNRKAAALLGAALQAKVVRLCCVGVLEGSLLHLERVHTSAVGALPRLLRGGERLEGVEQPAEHAEADQNHEDAHHQREHQHVPAPEQRDRVRVQAAAAARFIARRRRCSACTARHHSHGHQQAVGGQPVSAPGHSIRTATQRRPRGTYRQAVYASAAAAAS
mmetsp:Transcript_748/g.2693  ORF Transcript_748/g.2693 Transcript_748/m.2693 type:complete len:202 (+) Transcript_748:1473-2078(+)